MLIFYNYITNTINYTFDNIGPRSHIRDNRIRDHNTEVSAD